MLGLLGLPRDDILAALKASQPTYIDHKVQRALALVRLGDRDPDFVDIFVQGLRSEGWSRYLIQLIT